MEDFNFAELKEKYNITHTGKCRICHAKPQTLLNNRVINEGLCESCYAELEKRRFENKLDNFMQELKNK